ncbi:MAG: hypothetical protein LUQ30_01495 [Methanothrix sp.]|nr:hypothetical protein [Methanothrix sp.]
MQQDDRVRFEKDYREWIQLMSLDAACRLSALPDPEQKRLLASYQVLRDPRRVFRDISCMERIRSLAGERITSFILMETAAVTFFPSVAIGLPGALDYYIRRSSDRILAFALEHELEMSRIYQDMVSPGRIVTPDQKRDIMLSAQEASEKKLTITPDELREDDRLMQELALSCPLLPKPYAEMALLCYLEDNLPRLEGYGQSSSSPEEAALGKELAAEFSGWKAFTIETYDLFLREMAAHIRDANRGYA